MLPRLALAVAAGARREELLGVPAALSPEGGTQTVGEVSAAAEGYGIKAGMRLGEALARCPSLTLIPPDPVGVLERWEEMLHALESIGAAVEPALGPPALACFDAGPLGRLHGGLDATLAATRQALGGPARLGVAPTRFGAVAAASRARARRPLVVSGDLAQFLAPLGVDLLRQRPELAGLPEALEQLGIATLGELAALPAGAVADRFGSLGVLARRLACGLDRPLSPRTPGELVSETLELEDGADGTQLERMVGVLVDRLLARRERRGRSLRAVVMSAKLVAGGGTWHQQVVFRQALADPARMRLALVPRLGLLPAPALSLTLAVERFGPAGGDQLSVLEDAADLRATRLREAVRQARAAAGQEAALRVLSVDPDSRLAERRAVLAPFEG
ncbi:MAG: hypothetical protein J2O48_04530 [Solirubrobacterales bacterium]|nr:hypothetical protein [Solirubrobacterales bacterium]